MKPHYKMPILVSTRWGKLSGKRIFVVECWGYTGACVLVNDQPLKKSCVVPKPCDFNVNETICWLERVWHLVSIHYCEEIFFPFGLIFVYILVLNKAYIWADWQWRERIYWHEGVWRLVFWTSFKYNGWWEKGIFIHCYFGLTKVGNF